MTMAGLAFTLLLSGAIIMVAGTMLARSGDVIAARTGFGGVWVGSVFLALATSLPEIATDVSAIRIGAPDLAAGDLFGSSMANMLILAIVSLVPSGTDVFRRAALDHALYASLAIVLTCISALCILVRPETAVYGIGPGSLVLVAVYAAGSRAAFRYSTVAREAGTTIEMSDTPAEAKGPAAAAAGGSLRRAVIIFVAASLVILLAAPRFARSAEAIAEITGVGSTFIGTWLVGSATSLPELVTSLAAVRMRAYDLAVGNLFGSNALNMAVFAVLDAVYRDGPLLSAVDPAHAISALAAVMLMGIAVAALVYRAKGNWALLEPSSVLIIIGYGVGIGLIFLRGAGRQ